MNDPLSVEQIERAAFRFGELPEWWNVNWRGSTEEYDRGVAGAERSTVSADLTHWNHSVSRTWVGGDIGPVELAQWLCGQRREIEEILEWTP